MKPELPLAHLRTHAAADRVIAARGALARWVSSRGRWITERSVVLAFTVLGMMALLAFTFALARLTLRVRPASSGGPAVIYLMRARPPATSTAAVGAVLSTLNAAQELVEPIRVEASEPPARCTNAP